MSIEQSKSYFLPFKCAHEQVPEPRVDTEVLFQYAIVSREVV